MFQISAMINLKTKLEESSNRSCAKHNEKQLRQFRSFRYARFVLLFFFANVTVMMVRMKYDRF